MRPRILMVSAALLLLPTFAQAQTPAADGQQAFNNSCRTCHTVKDGDNRLGPSLFGIVGRKAGSLAGYNFSSSLAQSGITWDEANLDKFIEAPDQLVSGNAMKPYGGLTDAAQRKAIVDYLKTAK